MSIQVSAELLFTNELTGTGEKDVESCKLSAVVVGDDLVSFFICTLSHMLLYKAAFRLQLKLSCLSFVIIPHFVSCNIVGSLCLF